MMQKNKQIKKYKIMHSHWLFIFIWNSPGAVAEEKKASDSGVEKILFD